MPCAAGSDTDPARRASTLHVHVHMYMYTTCTRTLHAGSDTDVARRAAARNKQAISHWQHARFKITLSHRWEYAEVPAYTPPQMDLHSRIVSDLI